MADIARKLLIRAGHRVLILPPRRSALPSLGALPEDATAMEAEDGRADVVLLFVESRADQEERQGDAIDAAQPGGILWICYPKKTSGIPSDLSRDVVGETVKSTGWRPVTQVAIDEVWSALRMRPQDDVGSRRT